MDYESLEVSKFNLITAVQFRRNEIDRGFHFNGNATVLCQTLYLDYQRKGGVKYRLEFKGQYQAPHLIVVNAEAEY